MNKYESVHVGKECLNVARGIAADHMLMCKDSDVLKILHNITKSYLYYLIDHDPLWFKIFF